MAHKRNKIRFRLENESHLSSIADFSISRWMLATGCLVFLLLAIFLGAILVFFTPLHTFLPGYLKENQRSATEESLLRLDSLHSVYETNQRYIDNYLRITDTDRAAKDSLSAYPDTIIATNDSLILPSERERKFVAAMEEQERFNISVLAPLAADGMVFYNVCESGVFTSSSKDSQIAEIIIPADSDISAIADGTVVAAYYSPTDKGYVMIIQHARGFLSRYSHCGEPMVSLDEDVTGGSIIAKAPSPDKLGKRYIYLRMWHNGAAVIPYYYIHTSSRESDNLKFGAENSFEAPRGK
ncbi:MAG: M23 family metallopeptidase [Muribaculaceae bacterium]|nr:M23 family metallopeptidase [Muribaculaceae bacterium]